jgi:hypothetical protein
VPAALLGRLAVIGSFARTHSARQVTAARLTHQRHPALCAKTGSVQRTSRIRD